MDTGLIEPAKASALLQFIFDGGVDTNVINCYHFKP